MLPDNPELRWLRGNGVTQSTSKHVGKQGSIGTPLSLATWLRKYASFHRRAGPTPLIILAILAGVRDKNLFVTVHEIDPLRQAHRWIHRMYRKCETVLVFSENMKRAVEALEVESGKIVVTRCGMVIPPLAGQDHSKCIFFGGYNILTGKGYLPLLEALRILKSRGVIILLIIYVGHGCNGLETACEQACRGGVDEMIEWRDFFTASQLAGAYQGCKACIEPFTGGSARHPVTTAMANATPVIATRCVDIPEYLGASANYIDGSAESIADAISGIEHGRVDLYAIGTASRERAKEELNTLTVAQNLQRLYCRNQGSDGGA